MSKGRPFFVINDDDGNPINQITDSAIQKNARLGTQKGDSRSTNPVTGKKYPRGFTPPVDFYVDQEPIWQAKQANLDPEVSGLFVSKNKKGGKDLTTGRHIEYGQSLTVENEDGSISINGAGQKIKTELAFGDSTGSPISKVNLENLRPSAFYKDPTNIDLSINREVEYGQRVYTSLKDGDSLNQENRLGLYLDPSIGVETGLRYQVYNYYKDYSSKRFTHLLDYFIDSTGEYTIPKIKSIVLEENLPKRWIGTSLFSRTFEENEDPTMLAVDLQIKSITSPLLNDSLDDFIAAFGTNYVEIDSRKKILTEFRKQLKKFIPTDTPIIDNSFTNKSYYLQNISGLEKLVESPGPDPSYFVDFGKDLITLEFLEDVSQNMGYLSSLYKSLSYSRINGKELIPGNLLRFDIDINITEMRKYVRHMANPTDPTRIMLYADQISKYTYSLYECKFLFDKMPHGDAVSNAKTEILENFKLSFDYKFSNLKFKKFSGKITLQPDQNGNISYYNIDTSKKDMTDGMSDEKNVNKPDIIINKIDSYPRVPTQFNKVKFDPDEIALDPNEEFALGQDEFAPPAPLTETDDQMSIAAASDAYNTVGDQNAFDDYLGINKEGGSLATLRSLKDDEKVKDSETKSGSDITKPPSRFALGANKAFDQIGQGLKRAAINEVNRQIITQAALLNKTIDNIRNSVGLGRMSEPTNVYTGTNAFRNDVINTFRNALGNSVKSFFSKP
jgi:hypothetical protein